MRNKSIRKIARIGSYSLGVTIPVELLRELNWKEKQKVVVEKHSRHLVIKDWKK